MNEYDGPITDNHIHVDPYNGRGPVETAKRFQRAGGTCMIVIHKLSKHYNIEISSAEDLKRSMEKTVEFSEEINKETSVQAYPIVGVHPAEVVGLQEKYGTSKTTDMVKEALDHASEMYEENKIVGIGEIGRPHYEVSDEQWELSIEMMKYGMKLAAKKDFPVQLHTESMEEEGILEIGEIADEVGLSKVIKHFSPPLVNVSEEAGVFPSILAKEENIDKALGEGTRFLMETDYLDDLDRPGAVLGAKNVPSKTKSLVSEGVMNEEEAYIVHKENVESLYGVELE